MGTVTGRITKGAKMVLGNSGPVTGRGDQDEIHHQVVDDIGAAGSCLSFIRGAGVRVSRWIGIGADAPASQRMSDDEEPDAAIRAPFELGVAPARGLRALGAQ